MALAVERGARLGARRTAALVAGGVAIVVLTAYWHETLALGHPIRAIGGKLTAALGFALVIGAAAAGRGLAAQQGARPSASSPTASTCGTCR